jgi:protein-tyrosine-phosphatase
MMLDEHEASLRLSYFAMKKVLFICVHNSGRSQMAEAFFNRMANRKVEALSAGTQPSEEVNPTVVEAMREAGIDISRRKPKMLTFEILESADRVITMGCSVEKACPAVFVPTEDWQLDDPTGKPIDKVRQIRDQIKIKVDELVKTLVRANDFAQF